MGNLILFVNSFMSYFLLMAVIAVLAAVAVFIGIKMRKNKDIKLQQMAEAAVETE